MTRGADTGRALAALAVDPAGLGGLVLRARPGPARDAVEAALARLPGPARRLHPATPDETLFGGLDLAASLGVGRAIRTTGLVATPQRLILPMAERTPPGLAARLARILDLGLGHCLVALDEGAGPEEAAPPSLTDRLAFHIDLTGVRAEAVALPVPGDLDAARGRLGSTALPEGAIATLTALAARFGIDSLRAPHLALRAARALAALDGAKTATDDHIREAAELVYPARATQAPAPEAPPDENDAPEPDRPETGGEETETLPDDILVAAIAARLPAGLLDPNRGTGPRRAPTPGSGAGARQKGARRGRPLPARAGRPDGRARIDAMATLRAAAPWQALRRSQSPEATKHLHLHPDDLRFRRYESRRDRLLVFAVDASGSAALARLAEAKGAVEILLAEAYARRDQVALIAFRGAGAEALLPPTRALVQAKRRLAALPGGGGTPLAGGLLAAGELAAQARRAGLSPLLALLTDGRANLALDGTAGRGPAMEDARRVARSLAATGLRALVIDTSARPGPEAAEVAQALGARYLALPRADARRLSAAIGAARDDMAP
ncbi:MAG: magnesium chelatase ATPase subunit D [Roseovarius sp.]|nr:magnesium chelatase ATPase subunit D [Roseovarius sp.]MBK45790.1 magnesium chelatase ATPase subunit D [Roseovarius sp.]